MKLRLLLCCVIFTNTFTYAQRTKPPIMGWSSWNGFRVNIDDGYFGGRDSSIKTTLLLF